MATKSTQASDAEKRRAKLRELRAKRKGRPSAGKVDKGAEGKEASPERRRKVVKALMQRRRGNASGDNDTGRGTGRRMGGRAGAGMRRNAAAASGRGGEGLEQFPRLKAMLMKRRAKGGEGDESVVDASSSPEEIAEHIEQLKKRASRLESALTKTKADLEEARKLQDAAGSSGTGR